MSVKLPYHMIDRAYLRGSFTGICAGLTMAATYERAWLYAGIFALAGAGSDWLQSKWERRHTDISDLLSNRR